jgi:chondroitin AC lyase
MKKIQHSVIGLALALIMAFSQPLEAKVWYVGTWENKPASDVKATVTEAYGAAASGDQVWIAEGTYTSATITLKDGVSVYGSFAGTESALNERAKTPGGNAWDFEHPSILKNSGTGENCHVFTSGSALTLTIDGIVLEGTSAHGRGINVSAGGNAGQYTIQNCIIRNFTSGSGANNDGGGVNIRARAEIASCLITGNFSPQKGGGGYFDYTTIHDCLVSNNQTVTNGVKPIGNTNGGGGGLFITASSKAYNCRIEGNTASFGGGIYARGNIYNCIIVNNTASVSGSGVAFDERDSGGAVFNNTIANNRTTSETGAGVCFAADETDRVQTLYNNILYNNTNNAGLVINVGINQSGAGKAMPNCKNNIIDRTDYHEQITLAASVVTADSAAIFGENWQTLPTSPGWDKGTIKGLIIPDTDFSGGSRVVGTTIDIGPYEKQLSPPVVQSFNITEDTQVRGGTTANQSFPTETSLLVQKGQNNAQGEAFFRIPLAGLGSVADTDTVGKVELTLYLIYAGKGSNSITVQAFPVLSEWDANTLTWNNRGDLTYGDLPVYQGSGFVPNPANTAERVNEPVSFDITQYALSAYNQGKTEISLVFRCNNQVSYGYVQFYSIDHPNTSQHPKLSVYAYRKDEWNTGDTLYDEDDPTEEMFNLLMSRIRTENESNIVLSVQNDSVASYLTNYQAAGSFSDIDYSKTSGNTEDWVPLIHITRLYSFVFAYTMEGSAYYEDEELYNKIVAALQYWYDRNPYCGNWWYNQIGEPQRLGVLLIQMRKGKKKLPLNLVTATTERMRADGGTPGAGLANTGANRTDVALHWLYRACITADASTLSTALTQAFAGLAYASATQEGLQIDGSNFSHGTQLYIGGYGEEFIKGVTMFAMYAAGTSHALSGEKLEIFSRFVRETYLKTIRGQFMSWDVSGRGILSRAGESNKSKNGSVFCERLISIDPDNAEEYRAAIKRLKGEEPASYAVENRNRHYYIADYTLHNRESYLFDVRTVSTRTKHIEYGNGENTKSFFASDGCTFIAVKGNEYDSIFPVWNWTRIPGITCPQVTNIPLSRSDWQQPGLSTFAGGVSDSLYAATGYAYPGIYSGNSAKKGYFFFDDEVVCLGNDITSTVPSNDYVTAGTANFMTAADAFEINTTLNQCLLNGDIIVSSNGTTSTIATQDEHPFPTAPDWVLHDGIGYVFPNGGNVVISNKVQTGQWRDINTSGSTETQSKEVFSLWLNHGKPANKAQYAYIVVPNKQTAAEMEDYTAGQNIEILANTDSLQVVHHKTLDIWSMIFYKAASFEDTELAVKTNRSCALLLKKDGSRFIMHIANPSQAQTSITVDTRIPSGATEWKRTICNFAGTGAKAGASQVYEIDRLLTQLETVAPGNDPVVEIQYFNLMGQPLAQPPVETGIYIIKEKHLSNTETVRKELRVKN